MCRYGMTYYKPHHVCLSCRVSVKRDVLEDRPQPCPHCGGPMVNVGRDFAAPKRRDDDGWRTLAALVNAGLGFHSCGCGGPGYRPRTLAEVRERLTAAARTGTPIERALTEPDPTTLA